MAQPASTARIARRQRGVTLIESLVATAVVTVAAGTVAPGLATMRAHQAVIGAASEFETDVAHVRTLAVSTGTPWRISFESTASESCYVIHSADSGDCTCLGRTEAVCTDGTVALKRAYFGRGASVAVSANVRTMTFDGVRGTSTPAGTIKLSAARGGATLNQVVNVMGRVRTCSPDRAISGFKAC